MTAHEIHVSVFCNLIGGALFCVPHCNAKCALTLPGPLFVRWVGPGDEATSQVTTRVNNGWFDGEYISCIKDESHY